MQTTIIHCDRCNQTVDYERSLLAVQSGPLLAHRSHLDLCSPCAADLAAWLSKVPTVGRSATADDLKRPPVGRVRHREPVPI